MRITKGTISMALILSAAGAPLLAAQAPAMKWGPAPAVFPVGAKMAVLDGDPGKAEQFTVRLDFPKGYTIPAHFHPTDEVITVIKGTFQVGMGDKLDLKNMMALPSGGLVVARAKMNHFARAKEHTVVQVSAMGPFAMTYVNAADNPANKVMGKK